jgi:hypothetical protein
MCSYIIMLREKKLFFLFHRNEEQIKKYWKKIYVF